MTIVEAFRTAIDADARTKVLFGEEATVQDRLNLVYLTHEAWDLYLANLREAHGHTQEPAH